MDGSRWRWRHNPILLGLLLGWLIGMLWWAGLVIALEPYVVTHTVFSLLAGAPLVAIPWAVVGMVAGAVTWAVRGLWVPVASGLGVLGGGVYSLASPPYDGWLALTMPVCCLGGVLLGVAVGATAGIAWRQFVGKGWGGRQRPFTP